MAGNIPKRSASGRKQWSLQEGPRSSLKQLRNQLASEGCSESQFVLAKQLLENEQQYHSVSERKENEQLGIYWLIKASEQGNVEATELLKTCLKTGKGISEYNYLDVKTCISMTQDEKLTRKAAKEIFASLSNGGEYITTDQLQKKILSIDKNKGVKIHPPSKILENNEVVNGELTSKDAESDSESDTDWSQRSEISSLGEKLTEDHVISAAVDYSHGHLPLMSKSLCLTLPNFHAKRHVPYIYRSLLYPWLVMKVFYFKILTILGEKVDFFFLRSDVRLLILICFYFFFNSGNILYVIPTLLYYVTFFVMIIATCQMLQNQRRFSDFQLWSGLFLCYSGGSLNSEQAEHQYIKNNLKPYGNFFLALILNFLIYSVISHQWVPDSEITIISFCLTFITLIGFMPKKHSRIHFDMTVLLSFAINVLAKYPYESDSVVTQGWRFLDLKIPTFASYVIGNGIEFCLNFRLVLYAIIPILFIQTASKQNWRGTYQVLIPHCVTLSWLQICIISSQGATMYGLLRGVLALVGVVMFLPLFGLTTILLPAIALTKWIVTTNVIYSLCIFAIIGSITLLISWFVAQSRFINYTASIQVIMMLGAFITLINIGENKSLQFLPEPETPKYLTWNIYQKFCHQPIWQDENIALAQLNCAELDHSLILWDGYINDIKIKSIKNRYKVLLEKLPKKVYEYLSCYFGEEIDYSCTNLPENSQEDCQTFHEMKKLTNICSLQKFNEYSFEISIRMNSGIWGKSPEVVLIVEDIFKNFTTKLKPTDHIWFKGLLVNNDKAGPDGILGGLKPHILLDEIGCHTCQNRKLTSMNMPKDGSTDIHKIVQYVYISFKYILNVLFNPVIVFK
ncbi:hypothetical protein WA026_021433 [Henosepilachna vigintioctopunctata]|uniref:Wolframin n=1 Tax=Henosepilachna vigintioctopunctata TaxID=420089 RepID=A0AAW1TZ89_9CUCU